MSMERLAQVLSKPIIPLILLFFFLLICETIKVIKSMQWTKMCNVESVAVCSKYLVPVPLRTGAQWIRKQVEPDQLKLHPSA